MSRIAALADRVLELVSVEIDVSKELILSRSRKSEVVDARHMAVKLLHRHNVYPSRIADLFGISSRSVQYVITSFDSRMATNRSLRMSFTKLAKHLEENYE